MREFVCGHMTIETLWSVPSADSWVLSRLVFRPMFSPVSASHTKQEVYGMEVIVEPPGQWG